MVKNYIKFDCRYFNGSKPCQFKNLCNSCNFYNPMGKRMLIIKLASVGDVLRTTAILPALKRKYPQSFITWLLREPAQELLEGSQYIDRILTFGLESILSLQVEKFDMLISLDKAIEAVSLATLIDADEKYGFGLSREGKVYPFNKEAEYSFILGLDDDLKFYKNKKTYQQMIFDIANLNYANERYELRLDLNEFNFAEAFFKKNNLRKDDIVIGINTGAGEVFANKNLKVKKVIELIDLLSREMDAKILLLGGPLEKKTNEDIVRRVNSKVIDTGCDNSLREFAALINICSVIITADTLALHIAIALKKPVLALFGPTSSWEIDLYHRGFKIVTDLECAPCYKNKCDKQVTCMDKINLEEITKTLKEIIASNIVTGV
jgi:ADP-heptose:LPS heptosyltransferase